MLISGDDISNDVIAHAISAISAAIKCLDPSQVPVVTVDQPLFALGKAVGGAYDEDRVVVMLGGLHIEMAAFNALGKWILESGPTYLLTNASAPVRGCNRFFAISKPHNPNKTAACHHILMKKACEEFTTADLVTCLSPAYNQPVFAPHILRQLERVKRLDIGWTSTKMTL